jgi:rhodanese-related sulfurtransferase
VTAVARILTAVFAMCAAAGVVACGSSSESASGDTEVVLVDVRTPAEYAEGHLDGATLISLEASDFESRIAELDEDARYQVYCRTGNRSAQAATAMREENLDVEDLGGIDAAAETTGLAVVTG